MLKDIKQVKVLFQELEKIFGKENGNETQFIVNQLKIGLLLIEECFNSPYETKDLKQLYNMLEKIYIKINQPRRSIRLFYLER